MFHQKESVDNAKLRDIRKIEACKAIGNTIVYIAWLSSGITLTQVPYWWDRKIESLAATIYNTRPDLFKETPKGNPIPSSPPSKQDAAETKRTINKITIIYFIFRYIKRISYDSN